MSNIQGEATAAAAVAAPPAVGPGFVLYAATSLLLALTQGLGMNLLTANPWQVQGDLSATTTEMAWLSAVYMAPYASLSLILSKIRTQFGLRRFAELSIVAFLLVALLNLAVSDLTSALVVRFFSGVVAAPLSALSFFYMLERLPPERKMTVGISLAMTNIALGPTVARLVSPWLLANGDWRNLYIAEVALAMLACAAVWLLPLIPPPRAKVIHWLDVTSYGFIAVCFGLTAMVLTVGRYYWWYEAPFLGLMIAGAIASGTAAAVIELGRKEPFLDFRWLASRQVLHAALVLLIFRIAMSEQASGAFGFFQALGLQNEQMRPMALTILVATVAGGSLCAVVLKPGREQGMHLLALLLIGAGALLDSQASALTRPQQLLLSQGMIAFGGALFLPPAMASGIAAAMQKGPQYMLSFIMLFLCTQSIGGAAGSALVGSMMVWRSNIHLAAIYENVTLANPIVQERLAQLSGAWAHTSPDVALTSGVGLRTLAQQAQQQAQVLAWTDVFRGIGVIALMAAGALVVHMLLDWRASLRSADRPAAANL